MKSPWVIAAVVCVVLTSAAFAQVISPRAMGMGSAAVGVADDGAAWIQNPAGLGALDLKAHEGKRWAGDAIGAYGRIMDSDAGGVTWSGWEPAKALGFGVGYRGVNNGPRDFGAGFGLGVKGLPLSLGVNVKVDDPVVGHNNTATGDVGALCQFPQPLKAPIRVGLVARDVTNQVKTTWDVGVGWPATPNLLIAIDVVDFTSQSQVQFNAGMEYKFGQANEWAVRIGEVDNGTDNNLTLGAGYVFLNHWRLDAGWQNARTGDDVWSAGAGFDF